MISNLIEIILLHIYIIIFYSTCKKSPEIFSIFVAAVNEIHYEI